MTQTQIPSSPRPARKLWLASRSPRRRQMLTEAGIAHDAGHPGFEDGELRPGAVTAAQWVAALAYLKAAAGLQQSADQSGIILGADTAIVKDGQLIGTPTSPTEAREILLRLSGGGHQVITGVSLIGPGGRRHLFVDAAWVFVGELSDEQIDAYVATGHWQGKAGGYNLRERLAAGWPLRFEGDPTTIMGLPMVALVPMLKAFTHQCECALAGDAA